MGRKSKFKRAGFRGTQWHLMDRSATNTQTNPEAPPSSGSEQEAISNPSGAGISSLKLADAPTLWPGKGPSHTSQGSVLTRFSSADPPTYRLIDLLQLSSALTSFAVCSTCLEGKIVLCEDEKEHRGFVSKIVLKCNSCSAAHSFATSRLRPGVRGQSYDVNRRITLAAIGSGTNRASFVRFAGVMNMPPPPLYDSWNIHIEALSESMGTVIQ